VQEGIRAGSDPVVDGLHKVNAGVSVFQGPYNTPCVGGLTLQESVSKRSSKNIRSPGLGVFAQEIAGKPFSNLAFPTASLLPAPDQQPHVFKKRTSFLEASGVSIHSHAIRAALAF
jgi:hypothetical protein